MSAPHTLILLRHGESSGNADGIFTGILDVPLTTVGRDEAIAAASMLNDASIQPDTFISSPLLRSQQTAKLLTDHLLCAPSENIADWQLAERNYGALTGQRKDEILKRYGTEQFLAWRRSVNGSPPAMTQATANQLFRGRRDGITEQHLGRTESLRDVIVRVSACWRELIEPRLGHGRVVAVIAHGNSLRALCAVLDDLTDLEVRELNLPTGQPLVYQITPDGHPAHRGGTFLDPRAAHAAATLIAHEGGT